MVLPEDESVEGSWSYQEIFQRACLLRNAELYKEEYGWPIDQLEVARLKAEILSKGGVEAIDNWLREQDVNHGRLSGIKGMDWSFLEGK